MAETVALAEFKQWAKDVAPAAHAVLMAKVHAELTRERVNAYIRPIFARYGFTYAAMFADRAGQPIASPEHLYCADDAARIAEFFAECDTAHRAHGFTGPQGHCPALTAEHLLVQTEQALMDLAKPLFGIDHVYGDNRTKYLDLLIGACIKAEHEQTAEGAHP